MVRSISRAVQLANRADVDRVDLHVSEVLNRSCSGLGPLAGDGVRVSSR
jgi:hypothetical protein